jgi:hypothetical protein
VSSLNFRKDIQKRSKIPENPEIPDLFSFRIPIIAKRSLGPRTLDPSCGWFKCGRKCVTFASTIVTSRGVFSCFRFHSSQLPYVLNTSLSLAHIKYPHILTFAVIGFSRSHCNNQVRSHSVAQCFSTPKPSLFI